MLTIACVLKSGGIYGPEHVARLFEQVARNISQPYAFVCLTDLGPTFGMPFARRCDRIISLVEGLPGWWSKIELFRPGLFEDRVLYLDLDVTVCGSLDEIADYATPFGAIQDYERPTLNSSVMVWDASVAEPVFGYFLPDETINRPGGDQAWITEMIPTWEPFPKHWCPSYKHQCRYSVPKGAKVIVYHGWPKSWDLPEGHLVFA